jgi:hypothetical protein
MVTATQIQKLDRQKDIDDTLEDIAEWVKLIGSKPADAVSRSPEPFALGSLRDGRLRVVEPIEVSPMLEGGKHVLEAQELNEFGFGDNLSEALADLQAAIAELYLTLEEEQERLGPDLSSVWDVLSQKVRKADAINSP